MCVVSLVCVVCRCGVLLFGVCVDLCVVYV